MTFRYTLDRREIFDQLIFFLTDRVYVRFDGGNGVLQLVTSSVACV
jgi:hypothetical protein